MTSQHLSGLALVLLMAGSETYANNPAEREQRVEALEERIEQLETRLQEWEVRAQGAALGGERRIPEQPETVEPDIHIGGALRFNMIHRDFVTASKSKYGESGFDVFRLNVDGQIDNVLISAEYRYYAYMQTLHHGWIGYQFSDESQLQFGIHQVPFGLLPYAAHNAWFGVPYYVGLADNYDMGVKYVRTDGPWDWHVAFYKNEELNDATNLDRYSFDVVRVGEQQNEKINQVNARIAYNVGVGTGCETELGASAQVADVYNHTTDRRGNHWAAATHIDTRCGRWNYQLQLASYEYGLENPAGEADNSVHVGAFGGSYDIDRKADIVVANIAYNLRSPWESVDSIVCYNDYSRLLKSIAGARDAQINTTGCAIGVGPIFTYVDIIRANNMSFFGFSDDAMTAGDDDRWHNRFNINIGFYW